MQRPRPLVSSGQSGTQIPKAMNELLAELEALDERRAELSRILEGKA
jgi:hypothetical protein